MFALSEEQTLLRDAAHGFVADKAPVANLRGLRDADNAEGFDRALWAEMAQMGWAGVIVPEAHGGSALGYVGLGLILEALGRTLAPSPLLSTAMIGAAALALAGSEAQQAAWLPKIAAGEAITALAIDETAHHAPLRTALTAEKTADGFTLTGRKRFVADGHVADLLIVAARTGGQPGEPDGVTLFLVDADTPGLRRSVLRTADSRGAADLSFEGVAVPASAALGPIGGGWPILDQILDRARAGLAAEMLGLATAAFEQTADYLKTRTQFGQLIGSFQGLQHRAGKMFIEIELARSCVMAALSALDTGRADAAELVSLAKARTAELVHLVSNEMVQMHGGIGMTDAHDAGLYMKRARVAEALYGSAGFHRDRYASLLGF